MLLCVSKQVLVGLISHDGVNFPRDVCDSRLLFRTIPDGNHQSYHD